MEDKSPLEKTLEEILLKQQFDQLPAYSQTNVWRQMTPKEREILSMAHLAHGTQILFEQNLEDQAFRAFELSEEIAHDLPNVLYNQVLCLTAYPDHRRSLLRASKLLDSITSQLNDFFEAWYNWGNVLLNMGILSKDPTFFQESEAKYEIAFSHWKPNSQKEFFWHWGLSWQLIAKHSGEASDYTKAIQKYRQAREDGYNEPRFWNNFGNALFDLSLLISRLDLLDEAVGHYKRAIALQPSFPESWFNLACCYQKIFQETFQEETYLLAISSFEEAQNQDPTNPHIFSRWGILECNAGKMGKNINLVSKSLEKFARANELDPLQPIILSGWAEALMIVGSQSENIEQLREAEKKMISCLEIAPEESHYWYLLGTTLNEIGRYFLDADIYLQAIEKFQYGISLDRTDHLLWYGLALAHYAVGEIKHDSVMIEKAVKYCSRVIEFGGEMLPHFWNDWGVALMKLGVMTNNKKTILLAVEKFEQAIKRHNENDGSETMDAEWLYNYGCALDFLGDYSDDEKYYEKAVQVLSQAIAIDPSYTHARYNLALALTHLGESTGEVECFFKANDLFQVIIGQDSEDDQVWDDWGVSLLNLAESLIDPAQMEISQKLFHQAEAKFHQAAQLGSSQAYFHLACLHSLTGNLPEALLFLEKAETAGALPPIEELILEEWLEEIRETAEFKSFIAQLEAKNQKKSES